MQSSIIREYAAQIGIDLIGFTTSAPDKEGLEKMRDFVKEKRHGRMSYMENFHLRANPAGILPQAKSVIVIALNYYREQPPLPAGHGKIARYAYGRDYHKVIKAYLKKLEKFILTKYPGAITKICVDSAPLSEKSYAVKAGLGFIGKNTTLITKEFGSYVLLGELLTDLEFEYDKPINPDKEKNGFGTCGTCTRCIDACPTKALIAPYKMDARRCVSYLTIENKKEIPPELTGAIGCRLFGCDICQEVCPYNKTYARPALQKDFNTSIAGSSLPLKDIISIKNDREYVARFAGSPLMRAKRSGLQRNARAVMKNTDSASSQIPAATAGR